MRCAFSANLLLAITVVGLALLYVAVTNFLPMMDPYNYYSITPAIVVVVAVSVPLVRHPALPWSLAASLLLALVCGVTVRSSKIVRAGFAEQSAYAEIRAVVPRESAVIVDDYTASVLADSSFIQRSFHARHSQVPFDYIVVAQSQSGQLSDALKQRSEMCQKTL